MKNARRIGIAVLALLALLLAGRSWSEAKKPAERPKLRVGVINLNVVTKNYGKVKEFNDEVKRIAEPFVTKDKELKDKHDALVNQAQKADADRETIESDIKAIQREAEANKEKFQKTVGKKNEEQLHELFVDFEAVAARYAKDNDLDLVLQYNDAIDEKDRMSAANVTSKMQTRSAVPLYIANGIDISKDIVDILNKQFKAKKAE